MKQTMNHEWLLGLALTAVTMLPIVSADLTTTISSTTNWGTWEGFGVSLAWWAKAFGTRSDLADIFFSATWTTYNEQSIPGMGLTIARYNAGACSWNTVNGSTMAASPSISQSRQMESYWLDWLNSSSSWSWSVDASQRNMLSMAQSRGANIFELFSNSPTWWMCLNHNPSGSDDGSSNNLQAWNYDQHAVYLATIAQHAASNWGVSFQSVEAFNEPSSDWWNGKTGTQEGCHFNVSTQATVIGNLRTELNNRRLSSILISASDENTYDLAISTWNNLGSAATRNVGRINVHGYQYAEGRRDTLYSLASSAGKRLWNSEYGENDATGQTLVTNLLLDFRWLHPTAWVYWQAIDGSSWGLIDGNNEKVSLGAVSQKFFALSQFTRHIRPGMTILDGGSNYTVAAYDSTAQKLVIVAANWGAAQYLNFELSDFSKPGVSGALIPRWITQVGTGDQYVSHNDTYISGTKFWSYFPTGAVQTFEVSNVVL